MTAPSFDIAFTPKQTKALQSQATEILYGGAAGGGKSYFLRALAIILCGLIPGLNVYLFRRIFDDLIKNHMEGTGSFPVMLAPLILSGHVKIVEQEIRFWNGSRIFLCHCEHEKHRFKYQGAEIHVLLVDEATMFTEVIYRFLRGRMRAPNLPIPQWAIDFFKLKFGVELPAKIPLALLGSNPGNIGHQWVKASFIDGCLPFDVRQMSKSEGGMLRQYIPARLEDNPHIDAEDYEGKLEGLGSKELVRAMRHGDWNIIAGAFFDNIREDKHKIPGFIPPKHWTRFRSMDWGSAKPFSVGWWVVAEAEWIKFRDGSERMLPRGALVRYREWYGCKRDENGLSKPDSGLRLSAEAVGRGIMEREVGETIDEAMSRADPSMWKEDGGPSIAERMLQCDPKKPGQAVGPRFRPADNTRVTGWQQMYSRLDWEDIDEGEPMLFVTEDCVDWWRTVPALQHDELKREDIDTKMEDHAGDDCFVAGTLVETAEGPRRIEELAGLESIVLRAPGGGHLNAQHCRMTRRNVEVVRITFEDGTQVICTPSHRFETIEAWVKAIDTTDVIRYNGIWSKSSQKPSSGIAASPFTGAVGTSSGRAFGSIALSGKQSEAASLTGSMSTTLTRIAGTIRQAISSACRKMSMGAITAKSLEFAGSTLSPQRAPPLRNGMAPLSAGSGTSSTMRSTAPESFIGALTCFVRDVRWGFLASREALSSAPTNARVQPGGQPAWMTSTEHAPFVMGHSEQASTPLPRLAQSNAGSSWQTLRVLSVEPAGRADVYCLTVPEVSAFMIEGGISVHNCRYGCMARPVSRVKRAKAPGLKPWSLDWVIQQDEQAKKAKR